MSDRNTAIVFARMFEFLADDDVLMSVPDQAVKMARQLWDSMRDYDFSPYEMYCDDALIKLKLARRERDTYDPHGTVTKYGPKKP